VKGIEGLNAVYKTAYDGNVIKMPIFRFRRRIFPQRSYCTRRVITTAASSKQLLMVASTNINAYHFSSAKKGTVIGNGDCRWKLVRVI